MNVEGRIKSLRKSADALTKQINAKRNPAIAEQRPTARRARIAAGMGKEADWMEMLQSKLNAVANAFEDGTIPKSLVGIKTKKQIEYLHRQYYLDQNYPNWQMKFPEFEDREGRILVDKMGITEPTQYHQAIKDLAALGKEIPAEPTIKQKIAEKERELIGRKIPGFFTTPKSLAERMVDIAGIRPGVKVLEPSAGKGNIADVIREKIEAVELSVIEQSFTLREILELKGYKLVGDDFLEHSEKYDRIIQNPPFEKFQDIDHVRHAYKLLKSGGRLVSIMSESPFFRSDKKAVEFRNWFWGKNGVISQTLTMVFRKESSASGASARIIVIDKHEQDFSGLSEPNDFY